MGLLLRRGERAPTPQIRDRLLMPRQPQVRFGELRRHAQGVVDSCGGGLAGQRVRAVNVTERRVRGGEIAGDLAVGLRAFPFASRDGAFRMVARTVRVAEAVFAWADHSQRYGDGRAQS